MFFSEMPNPGTQTRPEASASHGINGPLFARDFQFHENILEFAMALHAQRDDAVSRFRRPEYKRAFGLVQRDPVFILAGVKNGLR